MFLGCLFFIFLGILVGASTGLIPGIHPNTVLIIMMSAAAFLTGFPVQFLICFVVSLAVSNTFFDFIPSVIFGAPEEDSVLSVLPGHRMLMEGRGYDAIFLTSVGGLCVVFLTLISLPLLFYSLPPVYGALRPFIHVILALVVLWMVYGEKKPIHAIAVFGLAGLFGVVTLNTFPSQRGIFPALTGLFGLSTIAVSIMSEANIPEQEETSEVEGNWLKGGITGWLAGLFAGLLPGIGSSQAGIIASKFTRASARDFIIALGGINTSNIFFTFIVFYVIGKTRSGAVWALSQMIESFAASDVLLVIITAAMSATVSCVFTVRMGGAILTAIRRIKYVYVTGTVFTALFAAVFALAGVVGVLVALTGMFMGLLAVSLGVKRTHLMGFLLLPTILFFSGLSPVFISVIW